MARIDKQLDKLSGEKLVRLHWPEDDVVDIELLRADLVREINDHDHRIPLDLRSVKGAPSELVDLLVDMERYAKSKSKILSTTWILPQLRDAVDQRAGRRSGPVPQGELDVASKTAREILNGNEKKAEYQVSSASRVERKKRRKSTKKPASKIRNYIQLVALIMIGAFVAIAVQYFVIFKADPIVIETDKIYEP